MCGSIETNDTCSSLCEMFNKNVYGTIYSCSISGFILHNLTQNLYLIATFRSLTANFIRHVVT